MSTERRPFHETIVEAILYASTTSEMGFLAELIKKTDIPKNHDAIITAWKKRMEEMDRDALLEFGVLSNLVEQRRANTKKSGGKKK